MENVSKAFSSSWPFGPIDANDLIAEGENLLFASSWDLPFTGKYLDKQHHAVVVGRKGTGKTTLKHFTRHHLDNYLYTLELRLPAAFDQVKAGLMSRGDLITIESCADIWATLLWNFIAQEVALNFHVIEDQRLTFQKRPEALLSYARRISDSLDGSQPSPIQRATDQETVSVRKKLVDDVIAIVVQNFVGDPLKLDSVKAELNTLLKNAGKKIYILIDSIEKISVAKDEYAQICFSGLVHCCANFHVRNQFIDCTLFFPGELYEFYQAKISGAVAKELRDTMFVRWTSKDLLSVSALRLSKYCELLRGGEYLGSDRYKDEDSAREYLRKVLPYVVTDRREGTIEGISFVLRYTQLTPRHILSILNAVCEECVSYDGQEVVFHVVENEQFVERMENAIRFNYSDILSAFRGVYPECRNIIAETISQLDVVHSAEDLNQAYTNAEIWAKYDLRYPEFCSMLSDIGVVGVVTDQKGKAVSGRFSYLGKRLVEFRWGETLCIHPIFSRIHSSDEHQNFIVQPEME